MIRAFSGGNRVYFVVHGDLVKIGTARSVSNRLRALRASSPHELRLLGDIPGSHEIETAIHRLFREERHRGEWFKASHRLRKFISECLYSVEKEHAA